MMIVRSQLFWYVHSRTGKFICTLRMLFLHELCTAVREWACCSYRAGLCRDMSLPLQRPATYHWPKAKKFNTGNEAATEIFDL